jgi:hypothetical protein
MVVQELIGLLGVKTDQASINKADTSLKNLTGMVKVAAGAFMALGAVKWVRGAISQVMAVGQETGRLAGRLGITTDLMQRLGYAAKLSGSDIEGLAAGLQKMQIQQVNAANGSADAVEKFKRFGVEIKNADGTLKDSGTLMLEMADGIGNLKSNAEKTAAVIGIFGRAAGPLVGMFTKGSKGIMEMSAELSEFGALMDEETIAATREYAKQNKRLAAALLGIKVSVAKGLIPILAKGRKEFMDWYAVNGKLIRQDVVKFFEKLAGALSNVVEFGGKVGSWLYNFWKNLNSASRGVLILTAALMYLIKILWVGVTPFQKWAIIITLILLAIEDLNVFLEGGNSLLGRFFNWLKKVSGIDIAPTIKDFAQALKVFSMSPEPFDWGMWGEEIVKVIDGYLSAAKETWAGWWTDIKNWFIENMVDKNPVAQFFGATLTIVFGWVQSVFDLVDSVVKFLVNVWTEPKGAFLELIGSWETAWYTFYENLRSQFSQIFGWFKEAWTWVSEKGGKVLEFFGMKKGPTPVNVPLPQGLPVLKGAKAAIEGTAGGGVGGFGGGQTISSTKSSYATVNAPVNMPITVNAAPGMDEKKIAQVTRNEVQSVLDRQNRKTMQALMPQKAV